MKKSALLALTTMGLLAQAGAEPRVSPGVLEQTIGHSATYSNQTGAPASGQGVTAYSGHVGSQPTDGTIVLQRSAIGMPVAA